MVKKELPAIKQFSDLVFQDFEEHPIWISCRSDDGEESWYDETDEESYRPLSSTDEFDDSDYDYLVKAKFTLNDGTKISGFFTPQETSDNEEAISYCQPHVFIAGKCFRFWSGIVQPKAEYMNEFYNLLNKNSKDVFPISYVADEKATKLRIKGRIEGFGHI